MLLYNISTFTLKIAYDSLSFVPRLMNYYFLVISYRNPLSFAYHADYPTKNERLLHV